MGHRTKDIATLIWTSCRKAEAARKGNRIGEPCESNKGRIIYGEVPKGVRCVTTVIIAPDIVGKW